MMPLTMAKAGETVTIQKITGKDEVRLHLAELGFVVGSEVTVVNEIAGNLIIQVKESRLARQDDGEPHYGWLISGKTTVWETLRNWIVSNRKTSRGGFFMKTLKDVKVGETVTVAKLHGEGPVKRRIMDMGITKGVEIYVRKVAPLGDPMELTVRNYELSVRKADAEMIEVV